MSFFFLQVRGSIPLLWEQIVDLTYKPKFEILKLEEAVSGCLIVVLPGFPSNVVCLFYCSFTAYDAASSPRAASLRFKKKIWGCVSC